MAEIVDGSDSFSGTDKELSEETSIESFTRLGLLGKIFGSFNVENFVMKWGVKGSFTKLVENVFRNCFEVVEECYVLYYGKGLEG